MSVIFFVILFIVALLFLLLLVAPFLGIGATIIYVIKKSTEKKTPEFLQKEKLQMEQKVNSLKDILVSWKNFSPSDITNNIRYSFSKGISNKLTGHIHARDGHPVIAFQRIDRGIYTNTRIVACSTDFKLYFEYTQSGNLVYYDDIYLGKIDNHGQISDVNNEVAGIVSRNQSYINKTRIANYTVEFKSRHKVDMFASSDRKVFLNNPRYKGPNTPVRLEKPMKIAVLPEEPYSLISETNDLTAEELKWVIAIGTFESVYHSFSFVT